MLDLGTHTIEEEEICQEEDGDRQPDILSEESSDGPNFNIFKANRAMQDDRVQIKSLKNYRAMPLTT